MAEFMRDRVLSPVECRGRAGLVGAECANNDQHFARRYRAGGSRIRTIRERHNHISLYQRNAWRASHAPEGRWNKDVGSFNICGDGTYPKTFLLAGHAANGHKLWRLFGPDRGQGACAQEIAATGRMTRLDKSVLADKWLTIGRVSGWFGVVTNSQKP